MTTAKQRAWRAIFARRYGGKKRITTKRRGGTMPRKRYHRRGGSGGFGLGKVTSMKNIMFTLGGAYIAPRAGISPQIGAAAGSYVATKSILGAALGYFVAVPVLNAVLGAVGGAASGGRIAGY